MNEGKEGKIFEKMVEAPAKALEKSVEGTGAAIRETENAFHKVSDKVAEQKPIQKAKEFWHLLGPGLTTGASDDDPSGIGTYSQTGAQYGFQLLWLSLFTFPLMAVVQEMCARIGMITGRGLAANIRIHFPRKILILCTLLLFAANTFNIGADLGALAEAVRLFRPGWSYYLLVVLFAAFILGLQIFSTYEKYAKYLKWLALILLSYIFSTLLIRGLDWGEILVHTVSPSLKFDKDQLILICAILGTTISPYLFFWQTSQEVEEEVEAGKTNLAMRQADTSAHEIRDMRIDVWSGMFLSNLAMFFIIAACAATLNATGITNINSAAQAAEALRPLAGDATYFLFAAGILGVGLLGIPVLAGSSSYAISESFNWREGLHKNLRQAYAFYGVIIISMIIGVGLNFIGLDPIKALIYSAVGNGLAAPIVLVLIVLLSSNKKIMGDWANGPWIKTIGWLAAALMTVAGAAAIYSLLA